MATIKDWSTTAALNVQSLTDIDWDEGMNPSQVNNSARDTLAQIAQFVADVYAGNTQYYADTGAADAYVITPAPAIAAYAAGQTFFFKATNANTGASTLNVSALGVKTILRYDGSALASGDIPASAVVEVIYDGTNFRAVMPLGVALLDADNAFTGQNTITRSGTGSAARALRLHHTGTGTEPPTSTGQGLLELYLQSAATSTPLRAITMFNDDNTTGVEYGITWDQDNSVGDPTRMAEIMYEAEDLTSTSEDGFLNFSTTRSGTLLSRARIRAGMTLGGPTGGDQGTGTLNAIGVYDDGSLLTCYPIEYEKTGSIDVAAWDGFAQDRRDEKGEVIEAAAHGPARAFASRPDLADLFDPDKFYAKMIAEEHLPSMPSKVEWAENPLSIGSISQRLWETAELQAVHIKRLSDRLAIVEAV